MTVLWVDASSGASGDMLLGALLGAGVPLEVLQQAVDVVSPEPVQLRVEAVSRNGFAATRCHVEVADSAQHRTWRDVRALLLGAELPEAARDLAVRVFERLAVGSGSVRTAHGTLPVPPPAVAALLTGVPSYAGPVGAPAMELCTPTGAALLTTLATSYGPQPPMTTRTVGVGAGGRDPEGHANVLRLLVGTPVAAGGDGADDLLVLESNVDDLDPRLWPDVITAVLAAGALDAWLTPILMKKGRPAHTFRALVTPELAAEVRATVFRETSTIGVREYPVARHALPREMTTVTVGGLEIAVKLARLDGAVVTAQPEYDDVVRAAQVLGRPVRDVLADATLAAHDRVAKD